MRQWFEVLAAHAPDECILADSVFLAPVPCNVEDFDGDLSGLGPAPGLHMSRDALKRSSGGGKARVISDPCDHGGFSVVAFSMPPSGLTPVAPPLEPFSIGSMFINVTSDSRKKQQNA